MSFKIVFILKPALHKSVELKLLLQPDTYSFTYYSYIVGDCTSSTSLQKCSSSCSPVSSCGDGVINCGVIFESSLTYAISDTSQLVGTKSKPELPKLI